MRDAEANDVILGDPGHGRGQLGRLQGCRVGLGGRRAYREAGSLMEKQTVDKTSEEDRWEREAVWRKKCLA